MNPAAPHPENDSRRDDPPRALEENGLSPEAVITFLLQHPEFLAHQPALLAKLEMPREDSSGVVSLAQRQTQVLRDRIRLLESRLTEMMHVGEENDAIVRKMTGWVRETLLASDPLERLVVLSEGLAKTFSVPVVALALWGRMAGLRIPGRLFPSSVVFCDNHDEITAVAGALIRPLCLPAHAYQARLALGLVPGGHGADNGSVAMIPLRPGANPEAFGILVLASADPGRFSQDHGVELLSSLSELASAALLGLPLSGGRAPGTTAPTGS